MRLSSWSVQTGNNDYSPAQMVATIAGTEESQATDRHFDVGGARQRPKSGWRIAVLVAAIVGTNAVTVWMMTRPAPDLLPEYRLLEPEPGKRLLTSAAGTYETGAAAGDRQLRIDRDGGVRWVKFGANRSVEEESSMLVQPAQSAGQPALLTSTRALIEIRDPMTVVLFGDTYRRKPN